MPTTRTCSGQKVFIFSHLPQSLSVALLMFVLSLLGAACAPSPLPPVPPPAVEEAPLPEDVQHTIKFPGETLGIIAKWYTGKSENWNFIVKANPGINPNRLKIGQTLRVPAELVVKRDALPKSAVRLAPPKPPVEQTPPAAEVSLGDAPGTEDTAGQGSAAPLDRPQVPGGAAEPGSDRPAAHGGGAADAGQAGPAGSAQPPADADAERERLLDELLTQ